LLLQTVEHDEPVDVVVPLVDFGVIAQIQKATIEFLIVVSNIAEC
jgi:hypothetical protein